MEIAGIVAIVCLVGSMGLLLIGGLLLMPIDKHLHPDHSIHP